MVVSPQNRVLLCVLDGVGYKPSVENAILAEVLEALPEDVRLELDEQAKTQLARHRLPVSPEQLAQISLSPVIASVIPAGCTAREAHDTAAAAKVLKQTLKKLRVGKTSAANYVKREVRKLAKKHRYVPWAIDTNVLVELRDEGLSIPTQASGMAVGFEDMDPPAQGNSETGHQQIGNLTLAPQVALQISGAIEDGSFYRNPALLATLEKAKQSATAKVGFCFLLSGQHGDDGRVHSAWNHLEAFCELVFGRMHFPPDRVLMEAILDGRDSHPKSSVEGQDGHGRFLQQLQTLLQKHNAERSLAWVVGRSVGMDRDYGEENTRADYELLTQGKGTQAAGIDGVIALVKEQHAKGMVDSSIPPIAVTHGGQSRHLTLGDAFVDLNFRADRQRAKVAALLGARDFLAREAQAKQKAWRMDWLSKGVSFPVCCLAEYHPDLTSHGATVAFPELPHAHNFLAILGEAEKKGDATLRYFLAAESNKALHMGYFMRGRREAPVHPPQETRRIIPSYGDEAGVLSDNDFYKTPQMKNLELAGVMLNELHRKHFDLLCMNFSNCDMVGHLLPQRYDAALEAYAALDESLHTLVPAALRMGYYVVITSDHGNIEDDGATHTANPVLTTFLAPRVPLTFKDDVTWKARLFDIGWCIGQIMDVTEVLEDNLPPIPEWIVEKELVGRPLLAFEKPVRRRRTSR